MGDGGGGADHPGGDLRSRDGNMEQLRDRRAAERGCAARLSSLELSSPLALLTLSGLAGSIFE